ncbi:hypothetical protein I7I48_08069 [Histoplasma ohiense]|nr:hypothetical protein I7I48_08069 [Histoplasma ohiense (nom. inval.)]
MAFPRSPLSYQRRHDSRQIDRINNIVGFRKHPAHIHRACRHRSNSEEIRQVKIAVARRYSMDAVPSISRQPSPLPPPAIHQYCVK